MAEAVRDNSAAGLGSGFEADFVEEGESKYKCPICLAIMRCPVQTKCGHRFCKACIKQCAGSLRFSKCPVDNTWFDMTRDVFKDSAVEREILSLRVYCNNRHNSCDWIGDLRDLAMHSAACPEVMIDCPNRCSGTIKRCQIVMHLDTCPLRMESCTYCSGTMAANDLTKHQLLECPRFPVSCGVCGQTDIVREEIKDHVDTVRGSCPLVNVNCAFQHVGCQHQTQRLNMSQHYEEHNYQHMLLFSSKISQQEERIVQQRLQLANLTDQYTQLHGFCQRQHRMMREQGELLNNMYNMQQTSTVGSLLWRVPAFNRNCSGVIWSPELYTSQPGYRFSMSLDRSAPSTNSTFIQVHMLRGRYDNILSFPFNGLCTVFVLNSRDINNNTVFEVPCFNMKRCNNNRSSSDSSRKSFLLKRDLERASRYCRDGFIYLKVVLRNNFSIPDFMNRAVQTDYA